MMKGIRGELLDELLEHDEGSEDVLGDEGLMKNLQKALMERAFGAELTEHLGYTKGDPSGRGSGNNRNGHDRKRVLTVSGSVGCRGSQRPQRELRAAAGQEGSEPASRLRREVVKAWQTRPLEPIYPVIFFDALFVKIRDEGTVRNKAIYRAETAEAADRLAEFERLWSAKHPSFAAGWRRHWEEIIAMFAFPPEILRLIYTTNTIESPHRGLRKIIKTRGHFPNHQAAGKLLFLALRYVEKRWKAPPKEWLPALNQFDLLFGERLRVPN